MTNGRGFVVRWLATVAVSGVLGACSTPAAQVPLGSATSSAASPTASGEVSEVGSFADHGVPNGVTIWLRVPAPGRDIPLLSTLMGAGATLDPNQVLNDKLGPSLSRSVDLARPIDLTVSGFDDGPTRLALAAGILDTKAFAAQLRRDFQVVHKRPLAAATKSKTRAGRVGLRAVACG